MNLKSLPNLQTLQAKAEEWNALKNILTIENPDSRWNLLQIWLRQKGDWQAIINQILQTPSTDDCIWLIVDALQIPRSMIALLDANGSIRAQAAQHIATVKTLYFDRLSALPRN